MLDDIGVHRLGVLAVSDFLLKLTPGADAVQVVARTVAGGPSEFSPRSASRLAV